MNIPMITGATTMGQLQKKVDTIAHNLANMDTVGYKRREATFQDILTVNVKNQPHAQKEMGRITPYGLRIGTGAKLGQTTMRYEQGAVQVTDRPLDIMLEGELAWFRVLSSQTNAAGVAQQEQLYTRNGALQLTPDSNDPGSVRLVTAQGWPILADDGQEISFDADYDHISIDGQGVVSVYYQDDNEPFQFQLDIVRNERPDLFAAVGDSYFRFQGDANAPNSPLELVDLVAGEQAGQLSVRQGALEMSNVDMAQEMTELIATQRLMQFQSRSISIADEMLGLANSIRG